jgi:hypothetical protein
LACIVKGKFRNNQGTTLNKFRECTLILQHITNIYFIKFQFVDNLLV